MFLLCSTHRMTQKRTARAGEQAPSAPDFDPVPLRYRRDGWTPARQVAFIRALAECGCVRDACKRVGMSPESAYELARRPDAQSFRVAWEIAMDNAVRRIGDEAFSRAIHGVAVPHFYKGELVGEHRRYDERLTMFILRYRDPIRYGKHLDRSNYTGHVEEKALDLADALAWVESDARRDEAGRPRQLVTEFGAANDEDGDGRPPRSRFNLYRCAPRRADREAAWEDEEPDANDLGEEGAGLDCPPGSPRSLWESDRPGSPPDVARGSSTSAPTQGQPGGEQS
jgi:hypothetical protein